MSKAIELEAGAFHWHILPELLHNDPHGSAAKLFHANGPPLDEWRSSGVARVVKDRPQRMVYRVVLPGLDFYLKQYRLADTRAWLRELVRPSKARLEWDRTLAVAERGVPTIVPLAFGETCERDRSACSFLATRTLPGRRSAQRISGDDAAEFRVSAENVCAAARRRGAGRTTRRHARRGRDAARSASRKCAAAARRNGHALAAFDRPLCSAGRRTVDVGREPGEPRRVQSLVHAALGTLG